jgi:hypothetical protein
MMADIVHQWFSTRGLWPLWELSCI